mgnify:CR=1 FL=1
MQQKKLILNSIKTNDNLLIYFYIFLLSLSAIFNGLFIIYNEVLFVKLKTFQMLKIFLMVCIINIALNILFFTFYENLIFASISSLISFMISFILIIQKVDINILFQSFHTKKKLMIFLVLKKI